MKRFCLDLFWTNEKDGCMCGIAGYITKRRVDQKCLEEMSKQLVRRGPDGSGTFYDSLQDWEIGLAQRRLAILDLSEKGHQPMTALDRGVTITYNGEIYNHAQLRKELQQQGYSFRSSCDTEVILNAYLENGVNSVNLFHGMFAYCIYDRTLKKLYLVRDRAGEKPLYYSKTEDYLIFASDLSALLRFPLYRAEIDVDVVRSYMWNQYIPAPLTIYKNTYKLSSGSVLTFDLSSNEMDIRRYWSLKSLYEKWDDSRKTLRDPECYVEEAKSILLESIHQKLVADVPVGVFLSGGIDSSLVAALAQESSEKQINTYAIGFHEKGFNEADFAAEVAKAIGTNHHELYVSMKDAVKLVPEVVQCYSEPFADNSQIPTMILSRFARQHVKVALSGDGGDELFCGYPSYLMKQNLSHRKWISRVIGSWTGRGIMKDPYSHRDWKMAKLCNATSEEHAIHLEYLVASQIIRPLFADSEWQDETYPIMVDSIPASGTTMEKAMAQDMQLFLQEDIMTKVDRAAMFYSLETRAPFLDHSLMEWSLQTPDAIKYRNHQFKWPLKELLSRYVSRDIIDRPKKGFGVPIRAWLHGDFSEVVREIMDDSFIKAQGIFDNREIQRFYQRFLLDNNVILDKIMWSYMIFQLWYRQNCLHLA